MWRTRQRNCVHRQKQQAKYLNVSSKDETKMHRGASCSLFSNILKRDDASKLNEYLWCKITVTPFPMFQMRDLQTVRDSTSCIFVWWLVDILLALEDEPEAEESPSSCFRKRLVFFTIDWLLQCCLSIYWHLVFVFLLPFTTICSHLLACASLLFDF